MPELADAIIRGSKNLDWMRAGTEQVVRQIRKSYEELGLKNSSPSYFNTRSTAQTWWDFDAGDYLDMRCISTHPSVCVGSPAVICTTDSRWLQLRRRREDPSHHYVLELGMKGVQIAYESLDTLLEEVFVRWPILRSNLQPMITAGQLPMSC